MSCPAHAACAHTRPQAGACAAFGWGRLLFFISFPVCLTYSLSLCLNLSLVLLPSLNHPRLVFLSASPSRILRQEHPLPLSSSLPTSPTPSPLLAPPHAPAPSHHCPDCRALGIFFAASNSLGMLRACGPPTGTDAAMLLNRLQIKPLAESSSGADISLEKEQIPSDACALPPTSPILLFLLHSPLCILTQGKQSSCAPSLSCAPSPSCFEASCGHPRQGWGHEDSSPFTRKGPG